MARSSLILIFASAALLAQEAQPPQFRTPEVHADGKITFRLYAPKANEVELRGDWMSGPDRAKLVKDNEGVWSVTLGPLRPDVYTYTIYLDGVGIVDPRNPYIKPGARGTSSLVEVPGAGFHELKDVPHGTVHINWYQSKATGTARRIHVYTPPGYEKNAKDRYPVLYLLHGSGDTDGEWMKVGRANQILDNLIAGGKARPMMIVMPDGHPADPLSNDPAVRGRNSELFEKDILGDVIPLVESLYRVAPGPQNRALAGLSMGGGQTLWVGLKHPDMFGYLGVFSSGVGRGPDAAEEFAKRYASALADPAKFQKQVKLFWIGIGKDDGGLASAKQLDSILTDKGIPHVFRESDGAHVWWVWRNYLAEFAPQLFRKDS